MLQMKLWQRWRDAFDLIVAPSHAVKDKLMEAGMQSVEIVYHGTPIQSQTSSLTSPPTVVFAGRLVKDKGSEVLLKAFAMVVHQMPEARLLLVGDGPERKALIQKINDLQIVDNVFMPGLLSRPEMEKLFSTAWVQAVPSLWPEPFGTVVIEAMMRGTAVVVSASGGLPELVQNNETGLVVPPNDPEILAASLLLILRNRDWAERMGTRAREIALQKYNENIYVDGFLEKYQQIRDMRK
jgi:glycosyltransferase involved in cell wall biosynthesis